MSTPPAPWLEYQTPTPAERRRLGRLLLDILLGGLTLLLGLVGILFSCMAKIARASNTQYGNAATNWEPPGKWMGPGLVIKAFHRIFHGNSVESHADKSTTSEHQNRHEINE